ncbi:MAG TPA: tRNA preQ1(34) S-adenosylmethionine ribosyltransferase-isomerase QueA [Gemmatimonadales bacterium]
MTADRLFRLSDFNYELPQELIAQRPTERRGESRLLVVERAERAERAEKAEKAEPPLAFSLSDLSFSELPSLIPQGDLLVLNTTRVRHARFLGRRPSGAPAEVLLIHPATEGGDTWVALGRPGSALRPGKRVEVGPDVHIETVEVLADGNRRVRFLGASAAEAVSRHGLLPLPPYIAREPDSTDDERYQTVYAEREGSVAAPTAGLHFTLELLDSLRTKGVEIGTLDLEVGPGTFKPVETEDLSQHRMHPERFSISEALAAAIGAARRRGSAVWAVGTTVVRALESAAEEEGKVRTGGGETTLFITPGFRFRVVDHLITNFHLPRSTLLILVCAFGGVEAILTAYRHAIERRYRFYSYGDAMVIV